MKNNMTPRKKKRKLSPKTKEILFIAGVGAFIAASIVLPGIPLLLKGIDLEEVRDKLLDEDTWEKFDQRRLKQRLKALRRQKFIRVRQEGEKCIVEITEKGRKRLLQYQLRDLSIPKPRTWDRKWRIVTYDIPKQKKHAQAAIRSTLKRLHFIKLQQSVYLYPYPCQDIIEFFRELYGIGEHVTILTVGELENDHVYREYFDL